MLQSNNSLNKVKIHVRRTIHQQMKNELLTHKLITS